MDASVSTSALYFKPFFRHYHHHKHLAHKKQKGFFGLNFPLRKKTYNISPYITFTKTSLLYTERISVRIKLLFDICFVISLGRQMWA